MGADREARSLKARAEQVVEATAATDDTRELSLAELDRRGRGEDAEAPRGEVVTLEQQVKWAEDVGRLGRALEATLLSLAAEERKQAPKAPRHAATGRRAKASDAAQGQPAALDAIVAEPVELPDTPIEPVRGDTERPTGPGHPQQYPSPDGGPLWASDVKIPRSTSGDPLPPRPPPTPPRGTP